MFQVEFLAHFSICGKAFTHVYVEFVGWQNRLSRKKLWLFKDTSISHFLLASTQEVPFHIIAWKPSWKRRIWQHSVRTKMKVCRIDLLLLIFLSNQLHSFYRGQSGLHSGIRIRTSKDVSTSKKTKSDFIYLRYVLNGTCRNLCYCLRGQDIPTGFSDDNVKRHLLGISEQKAQNWCIFERP